MVSLPTIQNISSGSYTVTVTAADPKGMSDMKTINFAVNDLSVAGKVYHTTGWEENRLKYNQAAAQAGRTSRSSDMFFPGEKFLLLAETTAINAGSIVMANSVTVQLSGTSFSTSLAKTASSTFQGSLWHNDMIRWGDRILDFVFTAAYSNGTVKTDTVRVYIVDDEYWRLHLTF